MKPVWILLKDYLLRTSASPRSTLMRGEAGVQEKKIDSLFTAKAWKMN